MAIRGSAAAIAALIAVSGSTEVRAWGAPGCTNLPEYNRALGALQGMTSACDMTVEQARRIIAAHDGPSAVGQPVPFEPDAAARRHRSGKFDR